MPSSARASITGGGAAPPVRAAQQASAVACSACVPLAAPARSGGRARGGTGLGAGLAPLRRLHLQVLRVDRALPAVVGVYSLVSNIEREPRALIERSSFRNNRARGILVKTSNVLIDSCVFENNLGPAVQAYPDGCFWFESGAFKNWTIRNSTVVNANRDPNWSNDQINTSRFAVGDVLIAACAVDWDGDRPDNCSGASVQGRHLRSCGNPVACEGCYPFVDVERLTLPIKTS